MASWTGAAEVTCGQLVQEVGGGCEKLKLQSDSVQLADIVSFGQLADVVSFGQLACSWHQTVGSGQRWCVLYGNHSIVAIYGEWLLYGGQIIWVARVWWLEIMEWLEDGGQRLCMARV